MSAQLAQIIASRLNMQPALIAPAHADMLMGNLRTLAVADPDAEEKHQIEARANMLAAYGYTPTASDKKFVYADGIAFIPVTGMLVNRYNYSWGYVTGYNFIRDWLTAAVEDADVKAIVLDCNSGGGEVSGCFELCADIRAARDVKPIMAVVDSASYSACYAIASSASKIVVTPSGGVGSIGVVAMHVDISKWLTEMGVKVTFIYSGDHKVDGNMFEPLPEPVRKSIQARVDTMRQEFVNLVAENRGLDPKVVFDTEAMCYTAKDAMDLGLIDAIAKPIDAVQAFFNELSGSTTDQEITMSQAESKPGADSKAATPEPNQAAAPAAVEQAQAETTKVDASAAVTAERERIKAITGHENAKDRAALANHLALNTDLSVDAAAAILAAAPAEKQVASAGGKSAFEAAMDTSDHPNVGAEAGATKGEMSAADRILASHTAATGFKH